MLFISAHLAKGHVTHSIESTLALRVSICVIFYFFLAMPSAIFSLQEFRLDSAWHRQELPARVPSCSSNQAVQRCKYLQPLTWPGDSWGVLPWEVLFLRLLPGTWLQGRA